MMPIPFKNIHIYLAVLYSIISKWIGVAFKFFRCNCLFQVDTSSQAKCRKSKHFIVHYSIVGAFERQSQKCLLEECSLRVMLPNSRPPQESSQDIVSGKLLERVHKNSFLYSDGAKAWPAVAKRMQKGFKVKQVSHRKQEFVRKSKKQIAGTQVADSRWKRLQKWIPATAKTLRRGTVNPELLKYIRSWQFRQMHARAEYLKILGQSLHGWKKGHRCWEQNEQCSKWMTIDFLNIEHLKVLCVTEPYPCIYYIHPQLP